MREFRITKSQDGLPVRKVVRQAAPGLTFGLTNSYFRKKEIKLNGKPAKPEQIVQEGDILRLYLPEELFQPVQREDPLLSRFSWSLDVLYEDGDVLILDKRPGQLVHPDAHEKVNTLITHVRAYLYQRGEYNPRTEGAFHPVPVNRIDRFTSGIVLFAKTDFAMRSLNAAIRQRAIQKHYLLICFGAMPRPNGAMENWILPSEKRVAVLDREQSGAKWSRTNYKTIAAHGKLSLIEAELETGRTHQIRAQFAHAGHPLLGDDQYGDRARNERYGVHQQALTAWSVTFPKEDSIALPEGIAGKTFWTKRVPYIERFFPDVRLDAIHE